ncbi:MAG: NAD(P)-dependent alcohol dehydrogenase [Clostridiales Family XIII bacterium]|jgi:threonine dehydrogenase-like Zn-dependent dehydrogenase|nr:NAD(P)-dependent alcohol dehydrogenase [Clostridiales Family XIII bacterium]
MKKFKGLAMLGFDKIGWIEKEVPKVGPTDALCEPLSISPCTSDVHTVWERALGDRHDLILGHEASAKVVEVGALVKDFKVGDKVIVPAITPDWEAVESQAGFSQHSHGMLNGWKFSNEKDGTFGEVFHVNQADGNLAHLPDSINIEDAVMLSDMVPTGFHGANNAEVAYGETVVVIGIGPVGLMAVAGSVLRGAGRVFAVGSRKKCQEVAKYYGATDLVNYKDGDIVDQIKDATGGKPVDKVIIAGGGLETFGQAVKLIRPGGIVSNINYLGTGDAIEIPRIEWGLGMGHIRIIGGLMPGGRKNMEYLAQVLINKRLDVSPLLTHRFNKLEDLEEGLLLMKDKPRDLIKPVITL